MQKCRASININSLNRLKLAMLVSRVTLMFEKAFTTRCKILQRCY